MDLPDRRLVRLANRIQAQLSARHQRRILAWADAMAHVTEPLQRLLRIRRGLLLCHAHGLTAAARRLRDRCSQALPDLLCELEDLQRDHKRRLAAVPSLNDIVGEIRQLQQEFGEYAYDGSLRVLSVTTEPITLEDIELGPFRIRLRLDHLARAHDAYEVEATDPHAAATDSAVTHPHVSHGRLCEGDAAGPIRQALQSGLLCDFFLLVRSVLTTYNPHSPYVSLAHWESRPCYDCGCAMNDDNRYTCESCDRDCCEDCVGYCRRCDRSVCKGCLVECPHCRDMHCERCLEACPACGQPCCESCLEDDLCPTCKDETERTDNEHEQEAPSTTQGGAAR